MVFFTNFDGSINEDIEPKINIARLESFYNRMKLFEKFILPIPGKGNLIARFAKPLEYKVAENGQGTVEPFTLEMLSQP